MKSTLCLLYKPEYIALIVSVTAIIASVYIAWRNRKYALSKEEYFKLKQVAEKIISKLIIIETHRRKLKIFFEFSHKANQNKNSIFIDSNDTFNKADFERNCAEVAALIDIYFLDLIEYWNQCLEKMSDLFTLVFILSKKIEHGSTIDWRMEAKNFNKINRELGNKPKDMADDIKRGLKKFKEENL